MATMGGGGRVPSDKGAPVTAPKKGTQGHQKEPQVLYDVMLLPFRHPCKAGVASKR